MTLRLRPAGLEHREMIIDLIEDTARWLRTKGTDQWSKPWPSEEGRLARIEAGLRSGTTWALWSEPEDELVGTITVEPYGDPLLWRPAELAEKAAYVHRLIVRRRQPRRKGLGSELLRWAAREALSRKARFLRIDVWTTNLALHDYYLKQDFEFVRESERRNYPSGALFQRPVLSDEAESPLPFEVAPTPGDG